MPGTEKHTLYCSFCSKSQDEVKKIIVGPTVFICDECTVLCFDILVEGQFVDAAGLTREQQLLRREQQLQELFPLFDQVSEADQVRDRQYALFKQRLAKFKHFCTAV